MCFTMSMIKYKHSTLSPSDESFMTCMLPGLTADKDKAKKRSITFCSMQKPPNVDYTVRFFASHPSATDVTGRGLAQLVIHGLQSKLGLTLQSLKQFSSMCGDGQYLKNNVCEHMETELENHLDELVLLLAGTWHKTSTRCSS